MDRRQFLLTGIATGASVSLGIAAWQYHAGTDSDNRDWVLSAILPALLYAALPQDTTLAAVQLARTKQAVVDFMPFLPQRQQQELHQLFAVLANRLTQWALTGHFSNLNSLSIADKLRLLNNWRDSYLSLLQQAYHGLRELLYGAYYGQNEHWQALNYTAPRFR